MFLAGSTDIGTFADGPQNKKIGTLLMRTFILLGTIILCSLAPATKASPASAKNAVGAIATKYKELENAEFSNVPGALTQVISTTAVGPGNAGPELDRAALLFPAVHL